MTPLLHRFGRPAALLIGGGTLFFSVFPSPPSSPAPASAHLGQPLRFWLAQLDRPAHARDPRATEALVTLAPASLPGLCDRLARRESPLRPALQHLSRAFPQLIERVTSADDRRLAAASVLAAFPEPPPAALNALLRALRLTAPNHPAADSILAALERLGHRALPSLAPLVLDPNPVIQRRALAVLDTILRSQGPTPAWSADLAALLSSQLASPDENVVLLATDALGALAPHADVALPRLLLNLRHPSARIRALSAQGIGSIGSLRPPPRACIPALANTLSDPSTAVQTAAARALGRFGPDAAPAVPALTAAATHRHLPLAIAATVSLGRIGPAAGDAVPSVLTGLDRPSPLLRAAAAAALGRIRVGAPEVVPRLAQAAGDDDAYVRVGALRALKAFGPEAVAAIPALMTALRDPVEAAQIGAVEVLGSLGPAATSAIPGLIAARNNNPSAMNRPVLEALARIEGHGLPEP